MSKSDSSAYLYRWPGMYVRAGGRIVEAPQADAEVARRYPGHAGKGPVIEGCRITILTARTAYALDEEIRVIHVVDVVLPGREVYVMGPKPVFDEYVNDQPVTPPCPPGDPLVPHEYNGVTLPSPAVDYNYDITVYRFDRPARYRIQWRPGRLRSNVLEIDVQANRAP